MKSLLVSCLVIGGSASGQTVAAPSCVAECTKALDTGSASLAEAMRALCGDMTGQRAMFQCLINSCHGGSYGPALGHVASACSRLGNDIGPLHPIEVHYAPQKRQIIPTVPGPVLPGPSTVYNTQILTFSHRLSMALECMAGSDGVLTVAVNAPNSAATPGATHDASLGAPGAGGSPNAPATQILPHQGHDGNADCTSSAVTTPLGVGVSSTSTIGQETGCPCPDWVSSSSSLIPSSQFGSASLLQGPTEQQSASLPTSTPTPILTDHPYGTDGKDCETTAQANFTTVASSRGSVTPLPAAVTSGSWPAESVECPESMSGLAATAVGSSGAPNATSSSTPLGSVTTVATVGPLPASSPCSNSSMTHATPTSLAASTASTSAAAASVASSSVAASAASSSLAVSDTLTSLAVSTTASETDKPAGVSSCSDGDAGCHSSAHLMSIGSPPAETTSCSSEEGGSAGVQGMGTASEHPAAANFTTVSAHHPTSTVTVISSTAMTPSSVAPSVIPLTSSVSSLGPHLNSSSVAASQVSSASSAAPGGTWTSSSVAASHVSVASSSTASPSISSPSSTHAASASADISSSSSTHAASASPSISSTSSPLAASSTHLTEAATYKTVEHSAAPAYVTPLAGYTYNGPAPEYVTLSASVTGSLVTHRPSTPAEESETGGIMGSQHTTTEEPGISGHGSAPPGSYNVKRLTLDDSAPLHTQIPADAGLGRRSAQHDGLDGGIDKTSRSANETQGKTSVAARRRGLKITELWMLTVLLTMMMVGAMGR